MVINDIDWRQIPSPFDQYFVSNGGDVYSVRRDRLLTKTVNTDGYVRFSLRRAPGKQASRCGHILVMAAWIGPKPKGFQVNHKDGNRQNNCLSNLEYVTPHQNQRHASRILMRNYDRKRLPVERLPQFFEMFAEGASYQAIGAAFNLTPQAAHSLVKRHLRAIGTPLGDRFAEQMERGFRLRRGGKSGVDPVAVLERHRLERGTPFAELLTSTKAAMEMLRESAKQHRLSGSAGFDTLCEDHAKLCERAIFRIEGKQ